MTRPMRLNPRKARAERLTALRAAEAWLGANGAPPADCVLVVKVNKRHTTVTVHHRMTLLARALDERNNAAAVALRAPSPGAVRILILGRQVIDAGEARPVDAWNAVDAQDAANVKGIS